MLSLSSLRTPLTEDEALDLVLSILTGFGFQTTAWQDGSIQKTIVKTLALCVADVSELARQIAEFGFNDFATGPGLTVFSHSRFANDRFGSVSTLGPMRLTSVSAIPYSIVPGQLIVSTPEGIQYRNTTGGTLAAGSTAAPSSLVLQFQARVAGASGNVPNSTVNRLLTPLAGVTVSNNEATPWYTTIGKDEESDTSLRSRNSTKWTRLSAELVGDAYRNIALEGGASKVEIADQNPRGPGTIDVYVAGASGPLSTPELTTLQADFAARVFDTDSSYPAGSTSRVAVVSPATQALDITATLYHDANADPSVVIARATEALNDLLAETPIGGFTYAATLANVITLGDLLQVLEDVEDIATVELSAPTADVAITPLYLVIEGTWIFSTVPVS